MGAARQPIEHLPTTRALSFNRPPPFIQRLSARCSAEIPRSCWAPCRTTRLIWCPPSRERWRRPFDRSRVTLLLLVKYPFVVGRFLSPRFLVRNVAGVDVQLSREIARTQINQSIRSLPEWHAIRRQPIRVRGRGSRSQITEPIRNVNVVRCAGNQRNIAGEIIPWTDVHQTLRRRATKRAVFKRTA